MSPAVTAIHIGFPRCASTWLQTRLFPRLSGLSVANAPDFCRDLTHLGDGLYDAAAVARQAQAAFSGQLPVLLTDESLAEGNGTGCQRRTAARLAALFPEAKILVVLRNQVGILKSLYKYDIRLGYGFADFTAYIAHCRSRYLLQDFFYHDLCAFYAERFPQVKILLFEQLFSLEAARDIAAFLGHPLEGEGGLSFAPVNAADDGLALAATRLLNRIAATKLQGMAHLGLYTAWRYGFGRSVRRNIPRWLAARFPERYDPATLDALRREFAASNAALQRFFDDDIRPLGYAY